MQTPLTAFLYDLFLGQFTSNPAWLFCTSNQPRHNPINRSDWNGKAERADHARQWLVTTERVAASKDALATCIFLDVPSGIGRSRLAGASIRSTAKSLSAATPATCAFQLD